MQQLEVRGLPATAGTSIYFIAFFVASRSSRKGARAITWLVVDIGWP